LKDLGHLDLFDEDTWTRVLDFVALHGVAPASAGSLVAEAPDSGGAAGADGPAVPSGDDPAAVDEAGPAVPVPAEVQAAALAP
jgi:hypothetical protein